MRSLAAFAAVLVAVSARAETRSPAFQQLAGGNPPPAVATPKGAPVKAPAKADAPENVGACSVEMTYETITAGPIILPVQGAVSIKGKAKFTCAVSETQTKTFLADVAGEGIAPGLRLPPLWAQVRKDGSRRVWHAADAHGNQLVYVSTRYASKGLQLPTPYRFIHGKESTATYYTVGGSLAALRLEVSPGVNRNVELAGDVGVAQEFDFALGVSVTHFRFTRR